MQVIHCHLWQRALLSIKLLTYAPNNTGLPGGQVKTTESLKKYSFSVFGVYSFYTVTAQRLAGWPSGWLCSWSRASEHQGAGFGYAEESEGHRRWGRYAWVKAACYFCLQYLVDASSTAEIPMQAPFNISL